MPDMTYDFASDLKSHRLPGLDLGEEFIYPHYDGRSILNIPSSICHWLGVPGLGAGPLAPQILSTLDDGYQNVVLILMDALSLECFRSLMRDNTLPVWAKLTDDGIFTPLTSIAPSTTSVALTSLWTGISAAEHGIAGYELWMKEYGIVVNTILQAPMSFQGDVGGLRRAGFVPETFIESTLLGTHLTKNGVQAYAFQHQCIAHSGLSRMLMQDVNVNSFRTQADLWVNVRTTLEKNSSQRKFIWVYWGEVDNFSHHYGPNDERTINEFVNFSTTFENLFLDRLTAHTRQKTLLILLSDHGQIETQPDQHYDLRHHPDLVRHLHIMPTGENRLAYLYLRHGQAEAIHDYIEHVWPGKFAFLDPRVSVESGLIGLGKPHPRLLDRLGDMIVVARDAAYLWWSPKPDHLVGRHGGLSAQEMLVPFLAAGL